MTTTLEQRAALLRDQVLKTWSPPRLTGHETPAEIAQTSVMQTLAFVFGRDFVRTVGANQRAAIDNWLALLEQALLVDQDSRGVDSGETA